MKKYNLSPGQEQVWSRLNQMLISENININNLYQLQNFMRRFALQVIAEQPNHLRIIAGKQNLKTFASKQDKEAFIEKHSKLHAWGNDAILYPVLEVLGYQPVMHLAELPPYVPFEQTQQTGLRIDVVNQNAANRGSHWFLKGSQSPKEGDCMYYMLAQQIQRDLPAIRQQMQMHEPASAVAQVQEDTVAVVTKKFQDLDLASQRQYGQAQIHLKGFSNAELIDLYRHAKANWAGNDTYLARRPFFVDEEQDAEFFSEALSTKVIPQEHAKVIRSELLHMLSREAWRNSVAFDGIMKAKPLMSALMSVSNMSEQESNLVLSM